MGVPAFFRWLSRKYPSIVANCVEEREREVNSGDGAEEVVRAPVDASQPNPNGVEFDNLYLDMNGIIHPCSHPESGPQPKNEAEMMVAIFKYIDRLFTIVRPRRLLYMAIDGVAPRAKMNQQRSRRFRAAQEAQERIDELGRVRAELEAQGVPLPPAKQKGEHFDSNCITPGTPFMARLAVCLRYYVHARINQDPAWAKVQVILSDANCPGEGEHKIMDYIRRQRASASHDANTHHCLCGADADLIMLGLATHEPNFTIIREEFVPNKEKPCELCNQFGHEVKNCQGLASEKSGEYGEQATPYERDKNFIFLRLSVLREYLSRDLAMPNLPFPYDFERAIDDWVFMCFFVGNDFLPHLPSLEIREGAIDKLIKLYKNCVYKTGGYLTHNGIVNLERVQLILGDLGHLEDDIFKRRQQNELNFRHRNKERRRREREVKQRRQSGPAWQPRNQFAPTPLGGGSSRPMSSSASDIRRSAYEMRVEAMRAAESPTAALGMKRTFDQMSVTGSTESLQSLNSSVGSTADEDEEEEPPDEVRLYEEGWKERYYQAKFEVSAEDLNFRRNVAQSYVEGLCWVLRYYYQGCPSWKWFFPFHYAPFASDFIDIGSLEFEFKQKTKPFNPLEQLMGVFPAASRQHLPPAWQRLMTDIKSPIIDFYPSNFKIDLNGKKYAWQGVALLPFVEEARLLKGLAGVYPDLTEEERQRNTRGNDLVFVGDKHTAFEFFESVADEIEPAERWVELEPNFVYGMAATLAKEPACYVSKGDLVVSPLAECPNIKENRVVCLAFRDPQFDDGFIFSSARLAAAETPPATLKPQDWDEGRQGRYRPQIGMTRDGPRASLDAAGHRMLRAGAGVYSHVAPPAELFASGRTRGSSDRRDWGRPPHHAPLWQTPPQQQQHQQQFSRSYSDGPNRYDDRSRFDNRREQYEKFGGRQQQQHYQHGFAPQQQPNWSRSQRDTPPETGYGRPPAHILQAQPFRGPRGSMGPPPRPENWRRPNAADYF